VRNKSLKLDNNSVDYSIPTPSGLDSFQGHLFNSFFQNTLPMLLNQYDSCSMANSIESRMPFLDYRLVEYGFSLPNSSRVGGGFTKRILREAMKGVVPQRILTDKLKLGFHPPQIEWFNDSDLMREWMKEIMTDKTFTESTIFDADKLKKDIVNYNKDSINDINKTNYIERLYGPICTTWWMNNNYS
jgi:asparagine synthase (glutamine-hydrolysing)